MRLVVRTLLALGLLAAWWPGPPARAETVSPCTLALSATDLPVGLEPDAAGQPAESTVGELVVCERVFRADPPGPAGLSVVRSLIVVAPTEDEAHSDFLQYRELLTASGWAEGPRQPLGEEALVFSGGDEAAGFYAVQQLVRRSNVLAIVEAGGTSLADSFGAALDLAGLVDRRIAPKPTLIQTGPARRGSIWPAVPAPTILEDAPLVGAPTISPQLQIPLGGLSGLVSLDREGTSFLAVTDRGPNVEVGRGKNKQLLMPLPSFNPSIVKLERRGGQLSVSERIGLRLPEGLGNPRTGAAYLTGLPVSEADEPAFDLTGRTRWGTDPYGVDPEGIVLDPRDGSYWISDEYGPSILHVATDGTVLQRLTPFGTRAGLLGPNARPILPAELARRKSNRGFEGIGLSPDGSRLFAIMQSPLSDPSEAAGERSRNVRLLTLDLTGLEPRVDGVYVYRLEPADRVGAAEQDDVKVSDLVAVSPSRVLVAERDSELNGAFRMVYQVELAGATNLLGWTSFGGRALEQLDQADLAAAGIRWLDKRPLVNLGALGWRAGLFEGLTLVDESTLAVVDDDGFGLGGLDSAGRLLSNQVQTRLALVKLTGPVTD